MNQYTAIAVSRDVADHIEDWGGNIHVDHRPPRQVHPWYAQRASLLLESQFRRLSRVRRRRQGADSWPAVAQADAEACDLHRWWKQFHGRSWGRPADTWDDARHMRACAGWLRAAGPRTCRLLTDGRMSRSGLTHYGPGVVDLRRLCPSPHKLERWVCRVMRRAAAILAPWDSRPSYRLLITMLTQSRTLPRPGKAAIRLARMVLESRLGAQDPTGGERVRPDWEIIAGYRIYRSPAVPGNPAEIGPADYSDFGPMGQDDRLSIWGPVTVCLARDGAIIADRAESRRYPGTRAVNRRTVCQVVVRCPSTGLRHHITVPPQFALPLRDGESAAARVRAAVAWTFTMSPADYRPAVES